MADRYLQARIKGTLHGSQTINVLNFATNRSAPTQEDIADMLIELSQAIIACALEALIPAVSSEWTLEEVDCKQLFPVLTDPVAVAAPAGTVGTRQAINCSFESVLMRIKTGVGGKRKRGRVFLPPPGDADITLSVLQAGTAAEFFSSFVVCLAGKFIGAGKTTEYQLGVLSRKTLKETNNNYVQSFTDATNLIIEQRISSLRSRKLGIGG